MIAQYYKDKHRSNMEMVNCLLWLAKVCMIISLIYGAACVGFWLARLVFA